ncbi:uncharacterized protein LOC124404536 [Diprion similis]|uniref:uncharacterized protein LOC124404536 n=1 Tax=Diprion similis TaxID=362088 RepID=UPI001EF81507|nr:uncharacterized protein LOC124404536 [Diprion similis]
MFYKLKHWSQRLLGQEPESSTSAIDQPQLRKNQQSQKNQQPWNLQVLATTATKNTNITIIHRKRGCDQHELPRPMSRELIRRSSAHAVRKSLLQYCYRNPACEESEPEDEEHSLTRCTCTNCTVLPFLTECGVCLEPLQGQKVHSCPICANLTCRQCASRLENCAFCRSLVKPQPNPALDRLLDRLALPCKNSRWGCVDLVDGDKRKEHETACGHATFPCPVGRHICRWHGESAQIEGHLQKVHELWPLIDNGIAVEISGFRGKAYAQDGRQYTVCLSCYGRLYVVKIVLFQGKLRLSVTRLSSRSNPRGTTDSEMRYGVLIEMSSDSKDLKALKKMLPFIKENYETRQIEVACDQLISREESDTGGLVKINILIKPAAKN